MSEIPIRCVLAKHHPGDHGETGPAARKPCGAVIRYEERAAEEPVPPVEPAAIATSGGDEVAPHAPEPPAAPSLASLVVDLLRVAEWVTDTGTERDRAANEHSKALTAEARARSAIAKHIGKGQIVVLTSGIFRSVPPRKPKGGEVPEGALWTLDAVKVAT